MQNGLCGKFFLPASNKVKKVFSLYVIYTTYCKHPLTTTAIYHITDNINLSKMKKEVLITVNIDIVRGNTVHTSHHYPFIKKGLSGSS